MCVISQLRGMLFLPAGALRAWAAVWITACVRGGGGYRDSSASTWSWPSHYLRGRARARCRNTRTHSHMHTDTFTRQQACLCAPLATSTTTTTAAATAAGLQLDMCGENNLT